MRKLLVIIFLGLVLWASPSFAHFLGGSTGASPPPVTCPMGNAFPTDGCAGANQNAYWRQPNAFQPGGYFNTVAGTTANYMATNCGPSANLLCRPPWNVVGVDFSVGNYTSCDINHAGVGNFINCGSSSAVCTDSTWTAGRCLLDPQLHPPTGCSMSSSGIPTGATPYLNCNQNTFAGTISHYNFGPVNGHGCTGIFSNNAGNFASFTADDIYYFDDSGTCTVPGNDNEWMSIGGNPYSTGVTITNSTIDFNNSQWDTNNGPCALTIRCNGWFMQTGFNNTITERYVAILHNPTAPIIGSPRYSSTGLTPTATYQYDFLQSWVSRAPNGHKELYAAQNIVPGQPLSDPGNTIGGFNFDHNVTMNDANATSSFGPTEFWTANNYGLIYATGPSITNNTLIQAHVGHRSATVPTTFSGCLGDTYSGGCQTTTGLNNILFITSESAPLGYGASLNCTGVSGSTYKQIPGPYPSGVVDEYGFDGNAANNYYPAWTAIASATPCSGSSLAGEISDSALVASHGVTPYTSPVFENNYIDVSSYAAGGTTPPVWDFNDFDVTDPISIASGSITGNVLTTSTSVGLEQGLYIYAANIPGCSTSMHLCPRIEVGATGTTFTLSTTLGTPISAEPMQAWNLTWCVNSAVLSGNRDMTGAIADSWLDQLSASQAGSGC